MKIEVRHRMIGTIPLLEVVGQDRLYQKGPLIVYYHGWQTQKELVLTQARKLAKEGFRVILPDAANHGERSVPVSPIPSLTFWQSIQSNLFEFSTILTFFERLQLVEWVGVGGVSMGGMTTTALLVHHPEIQAAACIMGTPSLIHYRNALEKRVKDYGRVVPNDYQELTSWIERYDLASHYEFLPKRPFLLWHGRNDEKIPFAHIQEFLANHSSDEIRVEITDETHLVKGKTMDVVTEFFVQAFEQS